MPIFTHDQNSRLQKSSCKINVPLHSCTRPVGLRTESHDSCLAFISDLLLPAPAAAWRLIFLLFCFGGYCLFGTTRLSGGKTSPRHCQHHWITWECAPTGGKAAPLKWSVPVRWHDILHFSLWSEPDRIYTLAAENIIRKISICNF